jgi:hypothetical protein
MFLLTVIAISASVPFKFTPAIASAKAEGYQTSLIGEFAKFLYTFFAPEVANVLLLMASQVAAILIGTLEISKLCQTSTAA